MPTEYTLPKLQRFSKDKYWPKAKRLDDIQRTAANRRGWGPGWPDCQTSKLTRIRANRLENGRARREVAELLTFLLKASNALGYDIRKASETDGGFGTFACRAIKNSNPPAPSNHSWGLAIDQNTRSNPMSRNWQSTTPPEIVYLFESAGWYWGGRYPGDIWFYDPMHFEYMGRPEDVSKDLENAKNAFRELGGETLYPVLKHEASNRAMVRVLQSRLNKHGHQVLEDGNFGNATLLEVLAFQQRKDLVADGIVGPQTWGALLQDPV